MKVTIAILILWLVTGGIYAYGTVRELQADLRVEQALNKACEADRMWKIDEIQQLKSQVSL
jgi:hypothetical protein